MAKRPSASDLVHSVAFDKRVEENPDSPIDYGNVESDWGQQFECRAAFIHMRGGESVLSARLSSQHVQVIRVRASNNTRSATTGWRIRDLHSGVLDTNGNWTGKEFNIRDIEPSEDRQWLDFLCDTGGVSG